LAQLAYWCEQAWGRQTQVAKAVGVTPQTVNDWLNGRKKMTGEQALRVSAFINSVVKQRRK
jgi:plasmid maintenance system antidote protein VapI